MTPEAWVEHDEAEEAGQPAPCRALTRTWLRVGAVVLVEAWRPTLGVVVHLDTSWTFGVEVLSTWNGRALNAVPYGYAPRELRVLP